VFPVIKGVQAGREYYVSMCPLRLIPKLFLFNEEELVPELRAQRLLNKARVPEIARYVTENPDGYVFSAITASVDADVQFDGLGGNGEAAQIGLLHIPMNGRFIINDGQHRRASIEVALRERPELADETIAVVFFVDIGLKRCQQMFADLNRYAIRPSRSLGALYDHRDERAEVARRVVATAAIFRGTVELERSTLSARSRRLFTLSAVYSATKALLANLELARVEEKARLAATFWDGIAEQLPEWRRVQAGQVSAGEVREDFIHSHGVVLHALGFMGNTLLRQHPVDWRTRLDGIKEIDWSRANTRLWEGRAMVGGRLSKAANNVTLTANLIKQRLGLALSPEEQRIEDAFLRGEHGRG
jgi:DNA sulfur modification protein DndB